MQTGVGNLDEIDRRFQEELKATESFASAEEPEEEIEDTDWATLLDLPGIATVSKTLLKFNAFATKQLVFYYTKGK